MPAQKRSAASPASPESPSDKSPDLAPDGSDEVREEAANGDKESEGERVEGAEGGDEEEEEKDEKEEESNPRDTSPDPPQVRRERDDSDAEANSDPNGAGEDDEFIVVKLAEIRKEVQCPICLGIIRKTRTVMECLHRFCRDCIDKSMRLSNNECPACRTHCASRRSLRDDPNFDALISALYPDIDKYEEEQELAFSEEEKTRNKKIQASIAETFRRQTEALGKRKSVVRGRNSRRRVRGRGRPSNADITAGSDDDEEEANGNEGSKESSSADEQSPPDDVRQPKRRRRWPTGSARSSPAKSTAGTSEDAGGGEENNEASGVGKETHMSPSPLKAGNMEVLSWGKNGTRSQNRHGATSSLAGRLVKGGRVARMVEHLRSLDENNNEVDVYLSLFPLDGESMPNLEKPYVCCKQTLSIKQICQFVAVNLSRQVEEIEIYAKKPELGSPLKDFVKDQRNSSSSDLLELLEPEKSLSELHAAFSFVQGNLDLLYAVKMQS
ncbi:E3 ubiquitin-protein ligase [Rhynchospora pubera]|uniref:E3 ubiquitin-protein ligase n=1 Tax=Rhynchospora pubera TaxID=906938 RepID=A0AAV8DC25_9POAL|nr:E3 ubiquitin-protein ligase [Rhynchospora pubera]